MKHGKSKEQCMELRYNTQKSTKFEKNSTKVELKYFKPIIMS